MHQGSRRVTTREAKGERKQREDRRLSRRDGLVAFVAGDHPEFAGDAGEEEGDDDEEVEGIGDDSFDPGAACEAGERSSAKSSPTYQENC